MKLNLRIRDRNLKSNARCDSDWRDLLDNSWDSHCFDIVSVICKPYFVFAFEALSAEMVLRRRFGFVSTINGFHACIENSIVILTLKNPRFIVMN